MRLFGCLKLFSFFVIVNYVYANELKFDTLDVSGSEISSEVKPFVTPGAVSHRSDISDNTQSLDSIVRSMPGSYTNTDQSQGTLQVNLRGVTGLGRVNTTIDGVTQTFFGTAADNGKFHLGQGTLGSSSFGAPIDQNFIVGVDIEKGTFSGGNGGLMGSANFRTIGVDDVVRDGNIFGFYGKYSYGSNKIGPNYMGTLASKVELEDDASLGFLFGYSGKKISQNYKTGNGDNIGGLNHEDDDGENEYISPFDPKSLTQRPKGYLSKIEFAPNSENKAILTYRGYKNDLAGRDITNNSYQLNYNYNPYSDFINFDLLLAYNDGKQKYSKDGTIYSNPHLTKDGNLVANNKAFTFDMSNTFLYKIADIDARSKFGLNYLNNEYKNNLEDGGESANWSAEATPFQPRGKGKNTTLYLDNEFKYDIFTLSSNLNLYRWNLNGHKPECYRNPKCFPKGAVDIDKDGTEFNYSLIGSLALHDLFSPFLSYSKSTRPPTPQEMFFADAFGDGVNPFLKPEKAKTWQIGFNSHKDGLFFQDDNFGLKALYYNTKVDDFIYNRSFEDDKANRWTLHLNHYNEVEFKGYEVELNYDMNILYIIASYSHQKSNQPINETYGNDMFGLGKITELPRDYATIDLGTRFFNKKLNIGVIAKYTGKAKRVDRNSSARVDKDDSLSQRKSQELPSIPTVYDLYAIYKPNDKFTFKFEVQNLTDKNYMDALNAYNSAEPELLDKNDNDIYLFPNKARGRTFLASVSYRF
ncbi:TonB-dependent receptor domain-containing protein [Campylobacter sputorum]|uniref:TonB-dependent receptor domain-containing protein n=1 Tax=Campylobacter sputorum TaxID=206 RepID=UPI00053BE871|nr:TonB-dependent receptor [Campylobacter sputorum]